MKETAVICMLMFILCSFSFGESAASNNNIVRIIVKGTDNTRKDLIISVMSLKEKGEYLEQKATADFKKIFALGYFSDVELAKDIDPEGLEIIVTVKEKPMIDDIVYNGIKEVGKGDLEEETGFRKGDPYDLAMLKKAVEKILAKYKEKGYLLAIIDYEIKEEEKGDKVKIIFNINEGRHMYISKIKFVGLKNFTENALKSKMETSEAAFLVPGNRKMGIG